MNNGKSGSAEKFQWEPQPAAAQLASRLVSEFCEQFEPARELGERMLRETGTRLFDWVDHLLVPEEDSILVELESAGFEIAGFEITEEGDGNRTWQHPGALLPRIVTREGAKSCLAIKVESAADFLAAQDLMEKAIEGMPGASVRMAKIAESEEHALWIIERHGERSLGAVHPVSAEGIRSIVGVRESFQLRQRRFERDEDGFQHALNLIEVAKRELGVDRTCVLFFAAERDYWMRRNLAARVQKARQDRLGLGWANHDHHTYRCSRKQFASLVRVLESLGFTCRERFYAGGEAGWGAQVLEQRNSGLTVFADVDLLPEEVAGDFAHEGLNPLEELGTIGLWCRLHGEAMLEAGLHHLEAQFDFDAAREQLAAEGIESMAPFTDFTYLKQAFTTGQMWPVDPGRLESVVAEGLITQQQADQFAEEGAIGSHLEILERNDGYNGFNQTGISKIIAKTDPRSV